MAFTDDQVRRYSRHIMLPEIGGTGQTRLLQSKVLVAGAGGLGSPLILYLAAAGVGIIGIVDDDKVDLSNLQRQILHRADKVGVSKVDSEAEAVQALNPDVQIIRHKLRLDAGNVAQLIARYDLVADGTDNVATRFLLNDACRLGHRPLVSAAVVRFDGQIATYKNPGPCLRCLYPEPPEEEAAESCAQAGILGAMAGLMGSLQAVEVVKELLGIGDSLAGSLLVVDGLGTNFRKVRLKADPACPLCGTHASIHDLSLHKERADA